MIKHADELQFLFLALAINRRNKKITSGFTLVELSVVLVIIGLIIAGIFVGTSLIDSATLRSQVKQFEELDAAALTFKIKYDCFPGDCANVTSFLTSPGGNSLLNGDGNGFIENPAGQLQPYSAAGESIYFMTALNVSELYPSAPIFKCTSQAPIVGSTILAAKIGGGGIIATTLNKQKGYYWGINSYNAVSCGPNLGNLAYYGGAGGPGVITPTQAYNFDIKIDDGQATTGSVRAAYTSGSTYTYIDSNGGPTGCVTGTGYSTASSGIICRLFVNAKW